MRRLLLGSSAAAALTAFVLASAPNAAAQESLVAGCEPPREGESGGWTYVAQSFTSQVTGALTRAEIDISKASGSGDYVLEIRTVDGSSVPTDTVLATATIPDAGVPTGDSFIRTSFPNPANVVVGQEYALVVHRSDGLSVGYRVGNDCPDGLGFASFSYTGTATDWEDFAFDFDMVFRVFTGTPECKDNLATIVGTSGDETLVGTPGKDVIVGLAGRDTIRGLGAKDRLCGNQGRDKLKGGGGNDFLGGASGNDRLNGGSGRDKCSGGPGDDTARNCEVERSI